MTHFAKGLAVAAAIVLMASAAKPAFAQTQPADQTINQSQSGDGKNPFGVNLQFAQHGNASDIDTSAFQNASGNVGVNLTAGNGNQQVNVALVDAHSPTYAFSGDYEQFSGGEGTIVSGAEQASITDQAFEYANGQIGANVASGIWNQQGNAVFVVADDTLSSDNVTMKQTDVFTGCAVCGLNIPFIGPGGANVSGHAFDHASGDVEVNVAAGDINHQLNSLTVAYGGGDENVTMQQGAFGHLYLVSGLNAGVIQNNAFAHANGNIEVNVASGSSNQQMNHTHVQTCGCEGGSQTIGQEDDASFTHISGLNFSVITDNAFQNASGQIGVNTAGGDLNQQANALSVLGH